MIIKVLLIIIILIGIASSILMISLCKISSICNIKDEGARELQNFKENLHNDINTDK